ncbi:MULTISPECIES: acetate--CoA ligase family protein [unclassified Sedimentibacter]|uniref:acetate--CoA ligase family protein n=1 Tax=unclassified Sedimentibacter TaxID=2649220 RepID=UPI0027DF78B8|nr:acetate--CoA ligase family protein [Sedimentibacter sp. MB35-C1]WMJ77745.1 acetate--CoA ligase family protein [Sedimentibacter sp. MB35-C1]
MLKHIHNPINGKMRVLGYCSGSGNTLWKILELQKEMEQTFEGCPFEVVGIFSDNPNSKAVETAIKENIPYKSIDIREYYKQAGAPLKDRTVRANYDADAYDLIKEFNADLIILSGYVWAITDIIIENYLVINVHPGDLSVMKDGKRLLAGHNGIQAAFDANMDYICSASHIVNKNIDAGPILIISEKIPVDYNLHEDNKDRFAYYLKLANNQSRIIGARTILEIALGNFKTDKDSKVYYKNTPAPQGLRINNWNENVPIYKRKNETLLKPKSIAVIGASNKPGIGFSILKNLVDVDFNGNLYAVNNKGENVLNCKGCTSILDIKDDVDMAVISIPSPSVLKVAEECGKKGIKSIICISAGFSEIGNDGKLREEHLTEIISKYNMRMIGPNCMGIANTADDTMLNSTILSVSPPKGNVAFITQSGSMGASIIDFANKLGIGFSVITSLGNQADVDVCDLMPMLQLDNNTKVILLYLESIKNPPRFINIMKKITKPVIVLKSGTSDAGARAASSHTGSLSGNDNVTDAFLKKTNVIRVETLEDAFLLTSTLSKTNFLKGNKIGILTNAGGPGILLADSLNKYGFEIPPLNDAVKAELKPMLLPEASLNNPIDVVAPAPAEHYLQAAKAMIKSQQYDGLIINCVPPASVDTGNIARTLLPVLKSSDIPVLSCFIGPTLGLEAKKVMTKEGIQEFDYPEQLARILNYMKQPIDFEDEKIKINIKDNSIRISNDIVDKYKNGGYVSVTDCLNLLENYGINMIKSGYIKNLYDIENLNLNYPVVAKIDHKDIVHKSDVGGVKMNIENKTQLSELFNEWSTKFTGLEGLFVQEQLSNGLELIIGGLYDESVGHSIIVGLGGILVEILKDVSFGHVPITAKDINRMINSLKSNKLLYGYRGEKGVNISDLKEILMRLNQMLVNHPEIEELDINPLIFDKTKNKFTAVDCRIKIRS